MSGVVSRSLGGGPVDLALAFSGATLSSDAALSGSDLALDAGLYTALVLSLFCDRAARADDVLPAGGSDRRGWWGDLPPDGSAPVDFLGSDWWLYSRAPATVATLNGLIAGGRAALAWMTATPPGGGAPVAARVDVVGRYVAPDRAEIDVSIVRQIGTAPVNHVFDLYWAAS